MQRRRKARFEHVDSRKAGECARVISPAHATVPQRGGGPFAIRALDCEMAQRHVQFGCADASIERFATMRIQRPLSLYF
jgi:hypothetical protein